MEITQHGDVTFFCGVKTSSKMKETDFRVLSAYFDNGDINKGKLHQNIY
jgi:hypothetical protein